MILYILKRRNPFPFPFSFFFFLDVFINDFDTNSNANVDLDVGVDVDQLNNVFDYSYNKYLTKMGNVPNQESHICHRL